MVAMKVQRMDSYGDPRFPQKALFAHCAFEQDGEPVWFEIVSPDTAVAHGDVCAETIELFRYFAEHITRFLDADGAVLAEYAKIETFPVRVDEIQPSQFYADAQKVAAVSTFVGRGEDIVVPLAEHEGRFVSLDGHTRLYAAVQMGIENVLGFRVAAEEWTLEFVREAQRRGVFSPKDLKLLPHEEYAVQWHQYCDGFFAEKESEGKMENAEN